MYFSPCFRFLTTCHSFFFIVSYMIHIHNADKVSPKIIHDNALDNYRNNVYYRRSDRWNDKKDMNYWNSKIIYNKTVKNILERNPYKTSFYHSLAELLRMVLKKYTQITNCFREKCQYNSLWYILKCCNRSLLSESTWPVKKIHVYLKLLEVLSSCRQNILFKMWN